VSTIPARSELSAGTVVRLVAAAAILVGGLVHLQLYFDGYRDFPDANLGRSFLANGIASAVIAAALVFRRDVVVRLAGAGLVVGTLVAFWISRTDRGIFGFTEVGLEPSPQAALALFSEIAALVLIAATFLPALGAGDDLSPTAALPAAAVIAGVTIVGAALWARTPEAPTEATPETTVAAAPTTSPTATTITPTTTPTPSTAGGPATTGRPGASTVPAPPTTEAAPNTTAGAPPTTNAPDDGAMTIEIVDFDFDPDTLTIPVGTIVEWVNNDSFAHTVVADDGSFESARIETGDRFSFTFEEAGTFPYICGIHPSMNAEIVVEN